MNLIRLNTILKMDDNGSSSKIEQKESVRIDVVKSEDNSIKILKSGSKSDVNNKPNKAEESLSQAKFDIIEYYEKMTAEIDIHTEKLLLSLPEALEEGREELLKMLQQEKERCLAALGLFFNKCNEMIFLIFLANLQ